MNIISRSPHRPGTKRNSSNSTRSSLVLVLAIHVVSFLLLLCTSSQSPMTGTGTGTATVTVTAFQLTPSTKPGEIIENQLAALRDGDIESVYKFASPGNKKQTGDVATFAKMVRSGPYRYLVGHENSAILLMSKMAGSRQFLVRVTSSSSASTSSSSLNLDSEEGEEDEWRSKGPKRGKKILEYWWSLSRCKSGEFTGSYMVDFVLPNDM